MIIIFPLWLLIISVSASAEEFGSLDFNLGPSVQIQRFSVPQFVARGSNASLKCDYVVQQHTGLYSLKWYKGSSQFYQYIPSKSPQHAVHSVKGLARHQVLFEGVDGRRVTLASVQMGASGVYRCELVAEGPRFYTTQRSANMTVVILPSGPPVISGSRNYYQYNERVELNCTSPPSRPAATLTWRVNGRQVPTRHVERVEQVTTNPAGLERLTTRLNLRVTHDHFRGDTMNITCEGRLAADLYAKSAGISIREPSSRWFTSNNLYQTSASSSLVVAAASWCGVAASSLGLVVHLVW